MYFFIRNFYFINTSPLFIITLFFIIGIICYTLLIPFLGCFVLLVCHVFFLQNKKLLKTLILCSFFLCVGGWLHYKELRDYKAFYTLFENKKITVTGTVIDKTETTSHYKRLDVIFVAIDTITTKNDLQKNNKTRII